MTSWQDLAISCANIQNCPVPIVLATVESESSTNIPGDSGNALGYGQVWPKWHYDAFVYAANLLGMVPVPSNDLATLTALVASDLEYSMHVAVRVIKQTWEAAKGDWAQFTYKYVGAGIPLEAFRWRQAIWNKYNSSSFDYTGQPQTAQMRTVQTQRDKNSQEEDGPAAFFGIRSLPEIPKTSYQVEVGSGAWTGDILYGRRYRVLVSNLTGEDALDVSDLRCTFTCVETALPQPIYSTVTIYNLSPKTENAIIQEGYRVIVEAGYEGSRYGIIFDGNVIQPIRNKEDGTTYSLTLVSMDSDMFLAYGTANFSVLRGQNSRSLVERLASTSSAPIDTGWISPNLSGNKLPRGRVVFGLARDVLRQIAQSEGATFYTRRGKINLEKPEDVTSRPIIELTPQSGLVGVPAQQDYGATIKMLMNPQIALGDLIHVDNSLIRAQQFSTGQSIYALDQDGIYRAIKVTHEGDTRGGPWYTTVETVSQSGILPNMISSGAQNPW